MFWKGTLLAEPREKPAHSHHPLLYTSPLTDTNLYSFHPPRHLLPSLILSSAPQQPPPPPPHLSSSSQPRPSPLAAICRIVHLAQSARAHCLSNASPPRTLRARFSARSRANRCPLARTYGFSPARHRCAGFCRLNQACNRAGKRF